MLTKDFVVLDDRFRGPRHGNVHVEKLYTGCRWAEGPAWFAAALPGWSDIPNNRMMRWDETDARFGVPPAGRQFQRQRRRREGRLD